jgi:hypothetical protein
MFSKKTPFLVITLHKTLNMIFMAFDDKINDQYHGTVGNEGVVRGLEGICLADRRILTRLE